MLVSSTKDSSLIKIGPIALNKCSTFFIFLVWLSWMMQKYAAIDGVHCTSAPSSNVTFLISGGLVPVASRQCCWPSVDDPFVSIELNFPLRNSTAYNSFDRWSLSHRVSIESVSIWFIRVLISVETYFICLMNVFKCEINWWVTQKRTSEKNC